MHRALTVALLACASCGADADAATFPPGLEPVEAVNLASLPPKEGADLHPEKLVLISGKTDAFGWVHGQAYVKASLAETWKALRDPEVTVDRRKVDEWSATTGVDARFFHSHRTHNIVNSIVTVEFDLTWRQDVVAGDKSDPTAIAARWDKTAGTSHIELLSGSLVARRVDDKTTAIEFIEHLQAMSSGTDEVESYLKDVHASIVARVRGQPLPKY